MSAAGIGAFSAGVAIPIVVSLLSRLFPSSMPAPTPASLDELKAKYRKWLNVMSIVMVSVTVPLAPVLWLAFTKLADWCASLLPAADLTFAPVTRAYWLFPSFMLALTFSGFAAMAFVQWRLGERYQEFLLYWSQSSKMNPIKANKLVLGISAGLCTVLVFLGLRPYVQLRGDDLVVQRYFSAFTERYPLSQIRRIRTSAHFIARNGDTVARREYVIIFSGDRRWTTASILADPDEDAKRHFIERLARRSRVPIEEVAVFARGEL